MKKMIRLFFFIASLLLQHQLFANTVIVKGYVKDSSNKAIANRTVSIYSDSTAAGCILAHVVQTNANGYYTDTLSCNGDIRKLLIVVENCTGAKIVQEAFPNNNKIAESNFTICPLTVSTTPISCRAQFSFSPTATGIKFNSANAEVSAGDSIISRTWSYGDSSQPATGNSLDPTHLYAKPGTYTVCLTIKTKKGCESKYCTTVIVANGSNDCQVQVKVLFEKTGFRSFRFNSSQSSFNPGDSIIQRYWKFGDNSYLEGNQISPVKQFQYNGKYEVCLKIKTARGCEKTACFSLEIKDSIPVLPACKAFFSFNIKDSTVTFNSTESHASNSQDSIISRTWYFMDGNTNASLTDNTIQPTHTYQKPGAYQVYLVIKTKSGCESKYTAIINIFPKPVTGNCKAAITFTLKESVVYFNSESSTGATLEDSITNRTWLFMDSSSNGVLTGNVIKTAHTFNKPGTYQVYLLIKTKSGCESKTSVTVVIPPKPEQVNCKAIFNYTYKDSTVYFNSEGSHGSSKEDSIVSRTWYYSDSSVSVSLEGNVANPFYKYAKPGTYAVTLIIKTKNGCESKFTGNIIITAPRVQPQCKAYFSVTINDSIVRFNSETSDGSSKEDSVISRTWYFNDTSSAISLSGNVIKPTYTFTKAGTRTVYLVIKTKNGCESKYAVTVVIPAKPAPTGCKAQFSFTVQNGQVKFNSLGSVASSATDSIVGRSWVFGDNSAPVTGNLSELSHTFLKPGTYNVLLYIKTKTGCESKFSATVIIAPANCAVKVDFTAERISPKKIQFNSSNSAAQGDSIIQRNWKFGDNTVLSGNVTNPVKEFPLLGVYTTCLTVKTLNGCVAETCKQVVVQDSSNLSPTNIDYVRIVTLNPNPVVTRMMATIWSRNENVESELSIFDIYGTVKWSIKKTLVQGNNVFEIPTAQLYHGPYFFKVSTRNGRDTKAFYKL